MLLRMMDPRMRQAAGMSGDPASEGEPEPGEPSLPGNEAPPDEGQPDQSAGSIGNRIVEMQANAPGVIPRQNAAQDDAADAAPPDLRFVRA